MTADLVPAGSGLSRAPQLTDYAQVQKFVNVIQDTEFVPRGMKGKGTSVLFAAVSWGLEAGLGPMQAIRGVQVIDGQVGPKPELARALVMQRGHTFEVREWNDSRCTVYGRRAGEAPEHGLEVTFTIEDAARAGLCSIKDGKPYARSRENKPLPWETYPKRMLLARATGDLCSAKFPDVTMGLSYFADELSEIGGQVYDVEEAELPAAAVTTPAEAAVYLEAVEAEPERAPEEPPPGVDRETGEIADRGEAQPAYISAPDADENLFGETAEEAAPTGRKTDETSDRPGRPQSVANRRRA